MPLVCGKTAYSMEDNLRDDFKDIFTIHECLELAIPIEDFF